MEFHSDDALSLSQAPVVKTVEELRSLFPSIFSPIFSPTTSTTTTTSCAVPTVISTSQTHSSTALTAATPEKNREDGVGVVLGFQGRRYPESFRREFCELATSEKYSRNLKSLCEETGIPYTTGRRLVKRYTRTGSWKPLPHSGGRRKIFSEDEIAYTARYVCLHPDIKIQELAEKCITWFGRCPHQKTIWRYMTRFVSYFPSDFRRLLPQRNDLFAVMERHQFLKDIRTLGEDHFGDHLFVDVTSWQVGVKETKGWSLNGSRPCISGVEPVGRKKRMMLALIPNAHFIFYQFCEAFVTKELFVEFVQHAYELLNEREEFEEGKFERIPAIINSEVISNDSMIQTFFASNDSTSKPVWLPSHSPFLSPCEECFVHWKAEFTKMRCQEDPVIQALSFDEKMEHIKSNITKDMMVDWCKIAKRFWSECDARVPIRTEKILPPDSENDLHLRLGIEPVRHPRDLAIQLYDERQNLRADDIRPL
jgi:hypothetical protein